VFKDPFKVTRKLNYELDENFKVENLKEKLGDVLKIKPKEIIITF